MFGKTFRIAGFTFAIWLAGVTVLAISPIGGDVGSRTTFRPANGIVTVPYQERSGRHMVHVRTSMGAAVDWREDGDD